jgi:glycosyltransferase involved in cell wall biosynthesis
MNTLLLCPALFASHGGIERILRLYLKALCELAPPGDRIALAVLNDATLTPAQLTPYATAALGPVVAGSRAKLRFTLRTLVLARHADRVVCGHVNLLPIVRLARMVNRRLSATLVAHGIEVWRSFSPREQHTLRTLHRILCVSDYTRRELLTRAPQLDLSRLVVQPNALDPQFSVMPGENSAAVATTASTAAPGLILSVARLDPTEAYKGIDHLIAALPAIRRAVPAAHLRVVGDGADRPRLVALAAEHHVSTAVEFVGRVDDVALRAHFAACQLFALPSRGEGFGLVYLEALAHGKPCIAADAGGAPEVVDRSCGAVVPYGEPAALASTCIATLQQQWDPAALRARADAFSFARFKQRLSTHLALAA